jgi:Protein of unknown function (DUF3293)
VSANAPTVLSAQTARLHPALLRAYRRTGYEAGGIKIHIGRRSAAADHLLLAHGARTAVFITAYNPRSRRMPPEWNQRMQIRLRDAVGRRPVLSGHSNAGHWSEAHLLVFGDPRPILRLARHYRQHALVMIRHSQSARLVVIS